MLIWQFVYGYYFYYYYNALAYYDYYVPYIACLIKRKLCLFLLVHSLHHRHVNTAYMWHRHYISALCVLYVLCITVLQRIYFYQIALYPTPHISKSTVRPTACQISTS